MAENNLFENKSFDQIKDIIRYNSNKLCRIVPEYIINNWIQKIEIFTNDYLYIEKYFPNIKLLNKELSFELHNQIAILLGMVRRFENEIMQNIQKDYNSYYQAYLSNNKKTEE